ncbi:PaaX family transcriptional regulator [Arthrobacter sp. Rue61a]|uniref:PaaX family transcriptional regulator n=1 Tax=Arthrobacter sp. Rue61a TaxID=1118963 RepID=UPI00027DF486|nr:PaaX family transcriptional regulator [Arthrobacter sp. Rue61a]AFR31383.1 putative transcriptional regulator, PaaX family [Arthrobacter sp. Rue61a]
MIRPISPRTVLEAFLTGSREASLEAVYDTANLAGIADQPIRLAIRRLISAGDVTQHGRGRAGTIALTSKGVERLERDRQGLVLAMAQDHGAAPWDGQWHLIAVTVPEHDRSTRDALRRELSGLGACAIATGLYVTPHHLLDVLPCASQGYLSSASTSDLNIRGTHDPRAIAEMLWPEAPIVDAYEVINKTLWEDAADTSTPDLVRLLELADAMERAVRDDPLVPNELRRGAWAPTSIRAAWAQRWIALQEAADTPIYSGWLPDG